MTKTRQKTEYGDFQTPLALSQLCCAVLRRQGVEPRAVVEPNCGIGSFVNSALEHFPNVERVIGIDVNPDYIAHLRANLSGKSTEDRVTLICESFFSADWNDILDGLPEPLLLLGNPPWVTNAELGALGSDNSPKKSNFQKHSGLDAITGKSNFDISEWMLLQELDWLNGRHGTLAMLCKTMVARKILLHAWKQEYALRSAAMVLIDAKKHFGAAVEACLLVCTFAPGARSRRANVFNDIENEEPVHQTGFYDGQLVADVSAYRKSKKLAATKGGAYLWRSGVKHDCAKVMELCRQGNEFVNKLGEIVSIEDEYLFPMLKGSEVAKGNGNCLRNAMLVTQRRVGNSTAEIALRAPRTWQYLMAHAELLDGRRSSIYRKRPRFSVFGVGDYSFAPWKVVIAGLYKTLEFRVVGSYLGKPVVLDDTAYLLPCDSAEEAEFICELLNSRLARQFFSAFVFWDSKRPVTVDLLKRLDLAKVADELGQREMFDRFERNRTADGMNRE